MSSKIYKSLVSGNEDILGHVAYSLYKANKIAYIRHEQGKLQKENIPPKLIKTFMEAQITETALDMYRRDAAKFVEEFLTEHTSNSIDNEIIKLNAKYAIPNSFWYGVAQSIAGSFIFLLMGWAILKLSGIWEILINKLML